MKNRSHSILAAPVFVALAAISTLSRAAEPRYRLIDLGSLGGRQFVFDFSGIKARLLNNNGTVVGGSSTPDPDPFNGSDGFTSHAFEWKNGALTDLGPAAFGDKANFSQAFWVNDLGHSVGIATYNASNPAKPLFKAGAVEGPPNDRSRNSGRRPKLRPCHQQSRPGGRVGS